MQLKCPRIKRFVVEEKKSVLLCVKEERIGEA